MPALREILTEFGFKVDDKKIKRADSKVSAFTGTIKKAVAAFSVYAGARGALHMISAVREQGDQLDKVSSKLGLSAASLQEYQFAAERTGVPITALNMGLQRFIRRTAEAAQGTGSALKTLQKYRIQVKNTDGTLRSSEDVLNDVADTIAGVEDKQERLRIAFALFDSEGVALVNTLKDGKAGLEGLRKQFRELGGGLSQDVIDQSVEMTDAMTDFNVAVVSSKNFLALQFFPAITRGIQRLTSWAKSLLGSKEAQENVVIGLKILGGVAVAVAAGIVLAFTPLILKFAAIGAAVAAVVFFFQDLWVALNGGESVIGKMVVKLDALLERLADLVPGLKTLREVGQFLGDKLATATFGLDEETQEAEFQRALAAARAKNTKRRVSSGKIVDVRKGGIQFAEGSDEFQRGSILQARNDRVIRQREKGNGSTNVTNNLQASVSVTAPDGATAGQVAEMMKRQGKKVFESLLSDAAEAAPQGAR